MHCVLTLNIIKKMKQVAIQLYNTFSVMALDKWINNKCPCTCSTPAPVFALLIPLARRQLSAGDSDTSNENRDYDWTKVQHTDSTIYTPEMTYKPNYITQSQL